MSEREYDSQGATAGFLTGLFAGGLIGAGVALLMAPRSGRRTRKRIRKAAVDLGDRAEERLERAGRDVRQVADEARRKAERSRDQVRRGVERGRKKLNL